VSHRSLSRPALAFLAATLFALAPGPTNAAEDGALTPGVTSILQTVATLEPRLREPASSGLLTPQASKQAAQTLHRYKKAAAAGFTFAQYNLAVALIGERGVAPDPNRAIALLTALSERGYPLAELRLAEVNLRGEGAGASRPAAFAWYKAAASDGNAAATRAVSLLGPLLTPAEQEKAAQLGLGFAAKVAAAPNPAPLQDEQRALDADLVTALDGESVDQAETLLAKGADPDAADSAGRSALINAAWRGRTRLVALLLEDGADADLRDREGHTALAWAAINGFSDIAQSLVIAGCTVDIPDGEGLTPLMRAAWNDHADIVRVLLDNGADPRRTDDNGKSALDRALSQNEPAIVALLRFAAGR